MSYPLGSTVADIGGLVAAVATLGLLVAAILGRTIAKRQLDGVRQQIEDQRQSARRRPVYGHLCQLFDLDSSASAPQPSACSDHDDHELLRGGRGRVQRSGQPLDRATADKALIYVADAMWLKAESFVGWIREAYSERRAYEEWEPLHEAHVESQRRAAERAAAAPAPMGAGGSATAAEAAPGAAAVAPPPRPASATPPAQPLIPRHGGAGATAHEPPDDAATTRTVAANGVFYAVIAFGRGYREESFRGLVKELIDKIIVPSEELAGGAPEQA